MNFEHIISDHVGLVHLICSVISLIAGTVVLISKKGTSFHKKMGYVYTVAMTGLLITAFWLYNLFGRFGIFHYAAVVSSVTLLGGIVPILLKKPKSYISLHYNFMYWSVFGLYGAFMAEALTRVPPMVIENGAPMALFYNLVGVAVFITMGIGYFIFFRKKKDWTKFEQTS